MPPLILIRNNTRPEPGFLPRNTSTLLPDYSFGYVIGRYLYLHNKNTRISHPGGKYIYPRCNLPRWDDMVPKAEAEPLSSPIKISPEPGAARQECSLLSVRALRGNNCPGKPDQFVHLAQGENTTKAGWYDCVLICRPDRSPGESGASPRENATLFQSTGCILASRVNQVLPSKVNPAARAEAGSYVCSSILVVSFQDSLPSAEMIPDMVRNQMDPGDGLSNRDRWLRPPLGNLPPADQSYVTAMVRLARCAV